MRNRFTHAHVRLAFVHDFLMALIVYPLAFWARLGDGFYHGYLTNSLFYVSWALFGGVAAIVIYYSDMHRGYWRYASLRDLRIILQSTLLITIIYIALSFLVTRLDLFPRSMPFLIWIGLVLFWAGPRLLYRFWRDGRNFFKRWKQSNRALGHIPILLYGEVEAVEPFLRHYHQRFDYPYHIKGIISPSGKAGGRVLHGVPLLGGLSEAQSLLDDPAVSSRPERVVVALDSGSNKQHALDLVARFCEKNALPLSRLPGFGKLQEGVDDSLLALHAVQLEDLLGRPQRSLDKNLLFTLIQDKTILITGAGGSIGSEICRQITQYQPKLMILLDHSEYALYLIDLELNERAATIKRKALLGSIRDEMLIEQVFNEFKPEIVFHAAAYKHVPLVESNPLEGLRNNIFGTRIIAKAARKHHCDIMVQISTDKSVRPTNIMGAAKRVAEQVLQYYDRDYNRASDKDQATRFVIVRFGNVLGSTGSVIPLFERQLQHGGPLTVTHPDITRYFMTIQEAVQLVLTTGAIGQKNQLTTGGIFILDMGEPVRIDDMARRMIALAGLRPETDIKIHYTGLRPGEKLYEELRYEDEVTMPTEQAGIDIAHPPLLDQAAFERALTALEQAIATANHTDALNALKQLVPEFNAAPIMQHQKK
ncbi:MAG: polysaccharide biosynthesis protein [Alphaproteobacteria bacterium]